MSLCQYLEYGRHVARFRRRRRRAYAPTSNTASHDQLMGFILFPIYGLLMGLRLAAILAAGAPLLNLHS